MDVDCKVIMLTYSLEEDIRDTSISSLIAHESFFLSVFSAVFRDSLEEADDSLIVLQEFRESDKLPKVLPSDEEIDINEPSHNAAPIHTRAINTAIDTSVRNHDEFQGKSNLYTGTSI
ncbi:16890_t:CDS:2, partial [Funneliformis caledonium]